MKRSSISSFQVSSLCSLCSCWSKPSCFSTKVESLKKSPSCKSGPEGREAPEDSYSWIMPVLSELHRRIREGALVSSGGPSSFSVVSCFTSRSRSRSISCSCSIRSNACVTSTPSLRFFESACTSISPAAGEAEAEAEAEEEEAFLSSLSLSSSLTFRSVTMPVRMSIWSCSSAMRSFKPVIWFFIALISCTLVDSEKCTERLISDSSWGASLRNCGWRNSHHSECSIDSDLILRKP
mmetsp:Transcript_23887/g.53701  ORF Transcript_23887/g.53701 Transcript_23887/m.53701 type:complete len:237 (-) Transcript_23887:345-1055(-)